MASFNQSSMEKSVKRDSIVCTHFKHNCSIYADCCDKWYPCQQCHNEDAMQSPKRHLIRPAAITKMQCHKCNQSQFPSQYCQFCRDLIEYKSVPDSKNADPNAKKLVPILAALKIGEYYCPLCKIWDNSSGCDRLFHCEKCNHCRLISDADPLNEKLKVDLTQFRKYCKFCTVYPNIDADILRFDRAHTVESIDCNECHKPMNANGCELEVFYNCLKHGFHLNCQSSTPIPESDLQDCPYCNGTSVSSRRSSTILEVLTKDQSPVIPDSEIKKSPKQQSPITAISGVENETIRGPSISIGTETVTPEMLSGLQYSAYMKHQFGDNMERAWFTTDDICKALNAKKAQNRPSIVDSHLECRYRGSIFIFDADVRTLLSVEKGKHVKKTEQEKQLTKEKRKERKKARKADKAKRKWAVSQLLKQ